MLVTCGDHEVLCAVQYKRNKMSGDQIAYFIIEPIGSLARPVNHH